MLISLICHDIHDIHDIHGRPARSMSRCRPPVRTLLVLTPLVYWCINLDLLHATWIPWIPWIAGVLMVDCGNDSYRETQRKITVTDCVIVILIFMDIYVSYDIL